MRHGAAIALAIGMVCVVFVTTLVVVPLLTAFGNICGMTTTDTSSASGGQAQPSNDLNQAILATSNGDSRLIAAKLVGTHLESRWNLRAVGSGSYGPYQIQNPRDVPPVVHAGITSAQAMDAAASSNYMAPAYAAALRKLERTNPDLWQRDPARAAVTVAYYAERPKYTYYVAQGNAQVATSWNATMAVMQQLNLPTDFGQPAGQLVDMTWPSPQAPGIQPGATTAAPAATAYRLGAVKPHLAALVADAAPLFNITEVGGYRLRAVDPDGHPAGLAADFMTDRSQGDQLAAYLQQHAARLSVDYVIWQQRIWNAKRPEAGWRLMEDRGSPIANHMDHVHVNVLPQPGMTGQGTAAQPCAPSVKTGGPVGRPGIVSGDTVTLAQRVMALPRETVSYNGFNAEADIRATAEGRLVTPGPFAPRDPCAARRPVPVSAEILQVVLDITQRYSITLGSTISSHDCDTGRHPKGRAIDINAINGVRITGDASSFTGGDQALYREFMDYVESVLPRGSRVGGQPVGMGGLGQQQCLTPDNPEVKGLNLFPDTCTHIHIDVGAAGPTANAA